MKRILCITAHPDDEAASFGGTLLKYGEQGVETFVICLTPGQAAKHRGNAKSDEQLAALRREEFAASCRVLKITRGEVLDYPDAALHTTSFNDVVRDLASRIRQLRPHIILAMGTEGAVTAHPDHSMAALFATLAFHWAARPDRFPEQLTNGLKAHRTQKLYYSTASFTLPDRPPVALAPASAKIEIGQFLETKLSAFKAHHTQAPLFPIFEGIVRKRGGSELFHLAATSTPQKMEFEEDLFNGIREGE